MSKLPPLPRSEYTNMQYQRRHIGTVYTSDQMHEYAKAAVLAEREACEDRVVDLFADIETPYLPDICKAIRARNDK